jgi:hypothetical protein
MAKTPRKTPIHRLTHRTWSLTHLVHHTRIKGEAAEAEVAAGVEATMRKENGTAFSVTKMMTIARITVQTRRDSRPSSRRRVRKRRELAL